jgi:hypothetical protein
MFKSGHTYLNKQGGRNQILCISVNHRTAVFRNGDSFSVKSLDKVKDYNDLGVRVMDWKSWFYKILG